jgi:hypothetical protein
LVRLGAEEVAVGMVVGTLEPQQEVTPLLWQGLPGASQAWGRPSH